MSRPSKVLTDEDRRNIQELACQGIPPGEIARRLGLPGQNVSGCYYRLVESGEIPARAVRLARKTLDKARVSRVGSRVGSRAISRGQAGVSQVASQAMSRGPSQEIAIFRQVLEALTTGAQIGASMARGMSLGRSLKGSLQQGQNEAYTALCGAYDTEDEARQRVEYLKACGLDAWIGVRNGKAPPYYACIGKFDTQEAARRAIPAINAAFRESFQQERR